MIEIYWDESFKRNYKKLIKHNLELENKFQNKVEIFQSNPFHQSLKTHKLSGKLQNYWAFSINLEFRIVFRFIDDNSVLFTAIGTHDDVY